MKKYLVLVVLLFCTVHLSLFSQKGKLETGKESLRTTKTNSSSQTSTTSSTTTSSSSSSRTTLNSEESFSESIGMFFFKIIMTVTYGVLFETPMEFKSKMHDAEIARYPFEKKHHGNFIYTDSTNYKQTRFDIANSLVKENKNLYGNNVEVNFRFLKRFSLQAEYLYLKEKIEDKTDTFSLYTALIKYYRIRTQKLDAWYGLGIFHVANNGDSSGFGLGVGADWFIKKPISFSFSHKWGYINENTVNKTKLILKYHMKKYHISSGYQAFKIGVSKINSFSIGVGASF